MSNVKAQTGLIDQRNSVATASKGQKLESTEVLRIYGFASESFVDGPGIRVVVFVQGCDNACPGCHNPDSWDIAGGEEYTVRDVVKKIKKASKGGRSSAVLSSMARAVASDVSVSNGPDTPDSVNKKAPSQKVRGVTFSGGEPFLQAGALVKLGQAVKRMGLDIATYTGHLYEELALSPDKDIKALLDITDYLIDGPYIQEKRDIGLKFRGSANQRIIDMGETRKVGRVVLYVE